MPTLEPCVAHLMLLCAGHDEEVHTVQWQPLELQTDAQSIERGLLLATSSRDRSIKVGLPARRRFLTSLANGVGVGHIYSLTAPAVYTATATSSPQLPPERPLVAHDMLGGISCRCSG